MCGVARREVANEKRSLGQTSGRKAPPPPNETSHRMIQLIGGEPGFTGIDGGIESGEICNVHAYANPGLQRILLYCKTDLSICSNKYTRRSTIFNHACTTYTLS